MTKQQFIKTLEENKQVDDPQELMDHRVPILQFYLTNYTNISIISQIEGKHTALLSKLITINKPDIHSYDFQLVNQAFMSLVRRIKEFK